MHITINREILPKNCFSIESAFFLFKEGVSNIKLAFLNTKIKEINPERVLQQPIKIQERIFHFSIGLLLCIPIIQMITYVALLHLGMIKLKKPEKEVNHSNQNPSDEIPKEEKSASLPTKLVQDLFLVLKNIVLDYCSDDDEVLEKVKLISTEWKTAAEQVESSMLFKRAVIDGVEKIRTHLTTDMYLEDITFEHGAAIRINHFVNENGNLKGIEAYENIKKFEWEEEAKYYCFGFVINFTHDGKDKFFLDDVGLSDKIRPIATLYANQLNLISDKCQIWAKNEREKVHFNKQPWFDNFFKTEITRQQLLLVEG